MRFDKKTQDKYGNDYAELIRRKFVAIRTLQAVLADEIRFHTKARSAGIRTPLEKEYTALRAMLQAETDFDLGKTPQK